MKSSGFNYKLAKKTMKEKGISQQDLADFLSNNGAPVGLDAIKTWFRNDDNRRSNPELSKINLISICLGLTIDDLIGGGEGDTQLAMIRITGEASCGVPISDCYQDNGVVYVPREIYSPSLYCVLASGDSMFPEIDDGDKVVCDPEVNIINGDLVHYKLFGESAIKVYFYNKETETLILKPINNAPFFQTLNIPKTDIEVLNDIKLAKVVYTIKGMQNNRSRRLKMVGLA